MLSQREFQCYLIGSFVADYSEEIGSHGDISSLLSRFRDADCSIYHSSVPSCNYIMVGLVPPQN